MVLVCMLADYERIAPTFGPENMLLALLPDPQPQTFPKRPPIDEEISVEEAAENASRRRGVMVRRDFECRVLCECRKKKRLEARLSVVPQEFLGLTLTALIPDAERHPDQPAAIKQIKENPEISYGICGTFGAGKSRLLWSLFQRAALECERVAAGTLDSFVTDHKNAIQASMRGDENYKLKLSIEELTQNHTKYAVFLDDIDKIKPTEYAGNIVFQMLDAIKSYGHQLVWTSNKTPEELRALFDRVDPDYGGAIQRRLTDGVFLIEMF
jgi:DNA replication protein DnaC